MAGAQDENRQHSFKKQVNRQDYNANTKRKNSFAGNNKNLHNTSLPSASGTVTTSPTTPTSSNHTSFTGSGPALPSLKPALEHDPVNHFNAQEVSNYLNNTWKETFDRYHDNNLPDEDKPELYRSEKAWGGGHVWGQKGHLMANGKDFFAELRKSSAQTSNAQPATAK